jgi:hypothetical protein
MIEERRKREFLLSGLLTLCRCGFDGENVSTLKEAISSDSSPESLRQQLHADNYKVCPVSHKIWFLALSINGQLAVSHHLFPALVPFLETDVDPFPSQPGLLFRVGGWRYS